MVSIRVSLVVRQKFQLESQPEFDVGPKPVESCDIQSACT